MQSTFILRATARTAFTGSARRALTTTAIRCNAASGESDIRAQLKDALKTAMKAKERETVGTIKVCDSIESTQWIPAD